MVNGHLHHEIACQFYASYHSRKSIRRQWHVAQYKCSTKH